jgi:hypothetical protein
VLAKQEEYPTEACRREDQDSPNRRRQEPHRIGLGLSS